MDFYKTLNFVRNKRDVVCPNDGFQQQLKEWEAIIKVSNFLNSKEKQSKEDKGMNEEEFDKELYSNIFKEK